MELTRAMEDRGERTLRLSADEWLAVAASVAMPLPGIDLPAVQELSEDVRRATIDAGIRGLTARGLLTFCSAERPTFTGELLDVLTVLDDATSATTVAIIAGGGEPDVQCWIRAGDIVVSERTERDGAILRFTIGECELADEALVAALGDVEDVESLEAPPIELSDDALGRLLHGEAADGIDTGLATAARSWGALDRTRRGSERG